MELEAIKEIIRLMKENELREFEFEKDGVRVRIKRGPEEKAQIQSHPVVAEAPPPPTSAPGSATATTPTVPVAPTAIKEISSPMVGTFYRSPGRDTPPYVEVGQKVDTNTVVCIIEAMKVMNEIKAGVKGVITEVLVENGKPVEFGQPLFRVQAE